MSSLLRSSAVVFRVRTEFIAATREVRIYVLCECGSGAWVAAISPFPDLFFDERPLIGRSVGQGLTWLRKRYSQTRLLAEVVSPVQDHQAPRPKVKRKTRPKGLRSPARQHQLALASMV